MITVRITVKPQVAEYVRGKYASFDRMSPVRFPSHTDIYLMIWEHLARRPAGCGRDEGNLEIVLPVRHGSKPPEYYNHLGARAQKLIARRLELMMWAEFRRFVETERHRGTLFTVAVDRFMARYGIESLSEDAFRKSYYRWRKRCYDRKNELV